MATLLPARLSHLRSAVAARASFVVSFAGASRRRPKGRIVGQIEPPKAAGTCRSPTNLPGARGLPPVACRAAGLSSSTVPSHVALALPASAQQASCPRRVVAMHAQYRQSAAAPLAPRRASVSRFATASSHPVQPNPSLKRSANGRPPGPGLRYAVHFLSPGPGVLPLPPA